MMKHLSLVLGVALIFIVLPAAIFGGFLLFDYLQKNGLAINVNYTGGLVLGEIADPEGDLLLQIPDSFAGKSISNSLDMVHFSIRLVRFPLPSGQGIENRLNLVAEFNGRFLNLHDLDNGFGCNVLHFYIDSPSVQAPGGSDSEKAAAVKFSPVPPVSGLLPESFNLWDFQVIVDGFHSQARIYDSRGKLIGESIAVYVREEKLPDRKLDEEKWLVRKTSIITALPVSLLGDVLKGEWHYYALTGIADAGTPSFLLASDGEANVYDAINSSTQSSVQPVLAPLVIKDGKMQ